MFPKKPFQKEKIQMQRRIKEYHPKTNPKKRKNVGAKDKRLPENHFFRSAISFCIIYPTTGHRPEMKDYEIKEESVMEGFHSASLKIMKRKKRKRKVYLPHHLPSPTTQRPGSFTFVQQRGRNENTKKEGSKKN